METDKDIDDTDIEQDRAWVAEDERPASDSEAGPESTDSAVPDVDVPLEAPEADVVEQAMAVPYDDADDH